MRIATQEMYTKNNNIYRLNEEKLQKSMERLSSGLRINRAADDSAGLNISERFQSKVNGLKVAKDNLSNATNMLKTAEGGLGDISEMLQRMRELTAQAQNGTYTAEQKSSIQNEVNQILKEIDHISSSTKYNDINLLNRDGGVKLDASLTPNAIKMPGASFIPTTASQPRTYDMLVQVDGFNFNTPQKMARLFQTQTGYLGVSAADGNIYIRPDGGSGAKSFGVKMPIGEKTRVSLVFDGSQATLYLNGEKKNTVNVAGMTSNVEFALGDISSGVIREGIKGTFFEASYYNRELTDEEIQSNYNGQNVSGAEGSWNFEESKGTTVVDISGNGNGGIMVGNASRTEGAVGIHTGYASGDSLDVSLASASVDDLNLGSLDITDIKALEKIDHGLEYVNNKRISIGSQINRLDFRKENVEIGIQNHSETLGKIKSLDFAAESSVLIKSEIMEQSVTAMLLKAKEYYQSSLNLLKA